jgi:hypothetical protein
MRISLILISFFFLFSGGSFAGSVIEDCRPEITTSSSLDRLARNISQIEQKYNKCDQVPKKDRKKKGDAKATNARVLVDMAKGCFVGLLKGFIRGLKDTISGFWDLAKLGVKLAKKFGRKMVNYLHLAYKSGITTLFAEHARDTKSFLNTVLKGLKAIPQMILEAGVKQMTTFGCYNSRAKANYVCQTMSYLGTDVLLAVLTGGASKIGYISKVQKAVKLGVRFQRSKLTKRIRRVRKAVKNSKVVKKRKAKKALKKELKGFSPTRAEKKIGELDTKSKVLKTKLDKADAELTQLTVKSEVIKSGVTKQIVNQEISKKKTELRLITREVTKNNSDLSHLRSKKLIYDLDKKGAIEIESIIPDGKVLNDPNIAKGRYPPWSEGGPVYEVRVKKRLEFCRGGKAGEAKQGAGRWFLPCATKNYRSKDENRWVNATADNPYDEFSKYKLRDDDIIQIGGINPILDDLGGEKIFKDLNSGRVSRVRGGGGEVQVFRPDADNKLGLEDLVRTVRVYNDTEIRTLQAQLARISNKEEVLKIRKRITSRVDDDEATSFLLEIEDKLSGLSELNGSK